MRRLRLASLALLALLLIGTRPASADWAHDPYSPLPLCAYNTSAQNLQASLPDGSGGMYALFADYRFSNWDLYMTHILSTGAQDPAWPLNGLAVCGATGDQQNAKMVLDGLGGVWVAWEDLRSGSSKVYVSHVNANGTLQAGIPTNGLQIDPASSAAQTAPDLTVSNGALCIAWQYAYSVSDNDIYAAVVGTNNAITWVLRVANSSVNQTMPKVVISGESGAFVISYYETVSNVITQKFAFLNPLNASTVYPVLTGYTNMPGATPILLKLDGIGFEMMNMYPNIAVNLVSAGTMGPGMSLVNSGTFGMVGLYPRAGNTLWAVWADWANNIVNLVPFSPGNPVPVTPIALSNLSNAFGTSDGQGGVLIEANSQPNLSIVATRVLANGVVPPLFNVSYGGPVIAYPTPYLGGFTPLNALMPPASDGKGGMYAFGWNSRLPNGNYNWGVLEGLLAVDGVRVKLEHGGSAVVNLKVAVPR